MLPDHLVSTKQGTHAPRPSWRRPRTCPSHALGQRAGGTGRGACTEMVVRRRKFLDRESGEHRPPDLLDHASANRQDLFVQLLMEPADQAAIRLPVPRSRRGLSRPHFVWPRNWTRWTFVSDQPGDPAAIPREHQICWQSSPPTRDGFGDLLDGVRPAPAGLPGISVTTGDVASRILK